MCAFSNSALWSQFLVLSHSQTPLSLPWNYCYLFYCVMDVVLLIVSYWLCW